MYLPANLTFHQEEKLSRVTIRHDPENIKKMVDMIFYKLIFAFWDLISMVNS